MLLHHLSLPHGPSVPTLGQGTWRIGEAASRKAAEAEALRRGIADGLTLIDTAEMYGDGATERFLGEALEGLRDDVVLVSKVYPQNAGGSALERACDNSLKRLKTDRIDLYLLHWRGHVPLADTVDGMRRLQRAGKILHWGVSNFDRDDMEELQEAEGEARDCACNQVLYNLTRRGPEWDLLPWMRARGMPLMAYSPLEQGRLSHPGLEAIAARHGVTANQIALAWVLAQPDVIAIPKAGTVAHVAENVAAAAILLSDDDRAALDRLFPPPVAPTALEML
ncbi:aldo/keto reductase [Lichenihabitans sp. Uapishka_5]|uniref:aldo/keto reductase n=1 Tax=Lichenihabitans sp. Uapishka_5 TaxID=3037302 RepID=UPI0029E7F2D8|nr:aldo/keto reductase [Lichenihabitans sp. Uapishka_5]MDX7952235.1 aldo/keto reductase [Lichenihabitans sp. Uapishka_5]